MSVCHSEYIAMWGEGIVKSGKDGFPRNGRRVHG